jgi:hypothetical protein
VEAGFSAEDLLKQSMKRKLGIRFFGHGDAQANSIIRIPEYFMLKESGWIALPFDAIMIRVGEPCWS